MASGTIKSSAIERFNIGRISSAQTDFIGYGVYDADKNTVRVYLEARGTAVSSTNLSAAIAEKYRPKANASLIGVVNGSPCSCGMSTAGVIYQNLTSSSTSAFVTGEYSL